MPCSTLHDHGVIRVNGFANRFRRSDDTFRCTNPSLDTLCCFLNIEFTRDYVRYQTCAIFAEE